MRKRIIHLSVDEFQDPMSLLYEAKPEWFNGRKPVYLRFSNEERMYYASCRPFKKEEVKSYGGNDS